MLIDLAKLCLNNMLFSIISFNIHPVYLDGIMIKTTSGPHDDAHKTSESNVYRVLTISWSLLVLTKQDVKTALECVN